MSQRQPPRFSDSEDDLLLSCVAANPALYDTRHDDYRKLMLKADTWEAIATTVGRDVDICKRRWKDIKDNYLKLKKNQKLDRCKWSLVKKLVFLDAVETDKRASIGEDMEVAGPSRDRSYDKGRFILPAPEIVMEEEERLDMDDTTSEEYAPRKRRFEELDGSPRTSDDNAGPTTPWGQEDDVDLFMRSIALQLKKLPPRLIAQAKLRILTTVNELQFGELQVNVKREPS